MKKIARFVLIAIIIILISIPVRGCAHRIWNPTEVLPNNVYIQLISNFVDKVFNYSFNNIEDIPGLSFFDSKADYTLPLNVAEIKAYKRVENLISDIDILSVSKNNWFDHNTVKILVEYSTLVSEDNSNYVVHYFGTISINDKNKKIKSVKLDRSDQRTKNRIIDQTLKEKIPLIQETVSHYLRLKHNYSYNSLSPEEAALYSDEKEQIEYAIARKRSETISNIINPVVVSLGSESSFFSGPKAIAVCEYTTSFNDGGSSTTRTYRGYVYLSQTSNGWEVNSDNTFPLNSQYNSVSLN